MNNVVRGYLFALAGIAILSPDALVIRMAGGDPLSIAALRGTVGGALMLLYASVVTGQSPKQLIQPAWQWAPLMAVLLGLGTYAFVNGISHAEASDVLVIIAFTPVFGAFLSALFLNESIPMRTWVAALVCALGIGMIFMQGQSASATSGLLWAVVAALALAAQFVVLRYNKAHNMVGVSALGNILAGVVFLILAKGVSFDKFEPLPTVFMLVVVMPISFTLLFLSTRHISAPETGLVMLLESVLGSFWVWLILQEAPSQQTLLAGALVLATLSVHGFLALRESQQKTDDIAVARLQD